MQNTITWFEIPVADLPRATAFYGAVLDRQFNSEVFHGTPMTVLKAPGLSGALVVQANRKPSTEGSLVYLDTGKELDTVLSRITKAGGRVVMPRTEIGPQGSIAVMQDTEGNHVGLHQVR